MPVPNDSLSMYGTLFLDQPAFIQGEKNFLLGTESGHLQRGHIPKRQVEFSGLLFKLCEKKNSAGEPFWKSIYHFKHKEHSATQVNNLGIIGTSHDLTTRELTWCKTNLRDRTSATVLTIPLSRRQGSNTAIVFWPAAPLEGSHIFTQTWGQGRISAANMYKPPSQIILKHLLLQTEEVKSN